MGATWVACVRPEDLLGGNPALPARMEVRPSLQTEPSPSHLTNVFKQVLRNPQAQPGSGLAQRKVRPTLGTGQGRRGCCRDRPIVGLLD